MDIGIISDTHGLMREEALSALQGSDAIIHAGDVGHPKVLEALSAIAPLTFIKGNVDHQTWAESWPDTTTFQCGSALFYVLHNLKELNLNPTGTFTAVICGHSHQPKIEHRDGVLFFNPGSAGPRRFKLPITVGRIRITPQGLIPEIIELSVPPARPRKPG